MNHEYKITSRFYDKRSYGTHGGVDIAVPSGTPIYAPCDGVVSLADDKNLAGRLISLKCGTYNLQFAHLSGYVAFQFDPVRKGDVLGYSGGETEAYVKSYTSGPHIHLQVKTDKLIWIDEQGGSIVINQEKPKTETPSVPPSTSKEIKVYMTHYTLGNPGENDATPCIGAEGKTDLCKLRKEGNHIIALTSDQRNILGIKWWDKVRVVGKDFHFDAIVMDEMNKRFRTGCIIKQGYCIKADYAMLPGEVFYSGPVSITKL